MRPRRRRAVRPIIDHLDHRCLLSGTTGFTPAQITAAYGLNGISFNSSSGSSVTGNGAGETIALIEMYHDPNLQSDLHTFDQQYGLPDPTLTVDNLAGTQTNSGWALEESLDVEWAHAIAPGANILVVEAAPANSDLQAIQNLMAAVKTANGTAGVSVVSMSWGVNEFSGETAYDSDFTTPGITYLAASGDSGGVEYPAASPDVVAVGGTTLTLSGTGAYSSETAWIDSGGGYSRDESEPAYQESVQTTGLRSTPDVAFDANPSTGVEVYETPPAGSQFPFGSPGTTQVPGRSSVGQASEHLRGRQSSPSSTRGERSPASPASRVPLRPCRPSTASPRVTSTRSHQARRNPDPLATSREEDSREEDLAGGISGAIQRQPRARPPILRPVSARPMAWRS